MKNIKELVKRVYREQRGLLALMIVIFLASLVLFLVAVFSLKPDVAVVKVGYGDIDGYRTGSWSNMFVFPLMAILFGLLHNFLILKIFDKKGDGSAKVFGWVTLVLIFGTFLLMGRLLGAT